AQISAVTISTGPVSPWNHCSCDSSTSETTTTYAASSATGATHAINHAAPRCDLRSATASPTILSAASTMTDPVGRWLLPGPIQSAAAAEVYRRRRGRIGHGPLVQSAVLPTPVLSAAKGRVGWGWLGVVRRVPEFDFERSGPSA